MAEPLYYIIIVATFVFFFLTFFIVYTAAFQNKKKVFFRQELMRAKMEIKEQTLKHIAYELHDNFGQIASLIKINLNTLDWEDMPKSIQKIDDTKALVRQLIMDLKTLSVSLNSDRISQLGLVKSLEIEVENINKTGQFNVTFSVEGSVRLLDANTTTILYRMSQEILNNAIKHSQAKHIAVSIIEKQNLITLVFNDDGIGFNINEAKNRSIGSGLTNLHSRAKLVNAHLSIQSEHWKGTTVSVEVLL